VLQRRRLPCRAACRGEPCHREQGTEEKQASYCSACSGTTG